MKHSTIKSLAAQSLLLAAATGASQAQSVT